MKICIAAVIALALAFIAINLTYNNMSESVDQYLWPTRSAERGANINGAHVIEIEPILTSTPVIGMYKPTDFAGKGLLVFINNDVPNGTVLVVKNHFHADGTPRVYNIGTPNVVNLNDLRW